jgi:hypothetical protein
MLVLPLLLVYNDVNGEPVPNEVQVLSAPPFPGFTVPSLIELIETGIVVPGIKATLVGMAYPGPDIKNAKISLKLLQLYSGYSSDPNRYLN